MTIDDQTNPLLTPLFNDQDGSLSIPHRELLRTILWPVVQEERDENATWPYWGFVVRTLKREGLSAGDLFATFPPPMNNGSRWPYGLLWRTSHGASEHIQPNEVVGLSLAGLRIIDPIAADQLAALAASFAADEDDLPIKPDELTQGRVPFNDRAARFLRAGGHRAGVTSMTVRAAAELLMHEYPPLASESGQQFVYEVQIGTDNLGWLSGVTDARGYLDAMWARIGPLNEVTITPMRVMRSQQQPVTVVHAPGSAEEIRTPPTTEPGEAVATSKKIFLVHGRDDAAKNQIARFVERSLKGDASVTILDEQANSGRTLIEKFQDHADESAYAVVLLTPDDIGGPTSDDTNPRARQNVIFEMGYFAGKLGRDRILVVNAGVENPSDISGLVYIQYPAGNWQAEIVRELRQAGFTADLP